MAGSVSFDTALSALLAARVRMDTASNNIANAKTPGYTRQRVELSAEQSGTILPTGGGVRVDRVVRMRDMFLDAQVRSGRDALGGATVRADMLDQVEQSLGEPDNGITSALSRMWSSFQDLSLQPSSAAARAATLSSLDQLASRVRSVSAGWDTVERNANSELNARVGEANDMLAQLAQINSQVTGLPDGPDRAQLMDQRDTILDTLAQTIGAHAVEDDHGVVRVSVGGIGLLDGTTVHPLHLNPDLSVVAEPSTPVTLGGEAGGALRVLTQDLPAARTTLDAFASGLADALNAQHQAGWVSSTQQGGPLVRYTPGRAAATLSLVVTDPSQLAVASSGGPPFPTADGGNAAAIAAIATSPVANGGTQTLDAAARGLATTIGASFSAATAAVDSQKQVAGASEQARDGQHGVSADEELASLLDAQHAYDAAARVMTTANESIQTLLDLVR